MVASAPPAPAIAAKPPAGPVVAKPPTSGLPAADVRQAGAHQTSVHQGHPIAPASSAPVNAVPAPPVIAAAAGSGDARAHGDPGGPRSVSLHLLPFRNPRRPEVRLPQLPLVTPQGPPPPPMRRMIMPQTGPRPVYTAPPPSVAPSCGSYSLGSSASASWSASWSDSAGKTDLRPRPAGRGGPGFGPRPPQGGPPGEPPADASHADPTDRRPGCRARRIWPRIWRAPGFWRSAPWHGRRRGTDASPRRGAPAAAAGSAAASRTSAVSQDQRGSHEGFCAASALQRSADTSGAGADHAHHHRYRGRERQGFGGEAWESAERT